MVIILFFSFLTSYKTGGQYAVAINVPRKQCQSGFNPFKEPFLTHDPSEAVRHVLRDSMNVYRSRQLIAAGVDKKNDLHSEHLLMYPLDDSPLKHLMNHNSNGCVVFYTLLSPCIHRCLNNDIIPGLDQLGAYQGFKAFIFTLIYKFDQNNINLLSTELKKIADRVPLYRCNSDGFILCGEPGSNKPVIDQCLN